MKIWVKMSSENRVSGAWFYDLEEARKYAKSWEMLIPVEFPAWPNVADDNHPEALPRPREEPPK
jgi:hypothetical protein